MQDVESFTRGTVQRYDDPIIYVVRHGETAQNKNKVFRGYEGDGLDESGVAQSMEARRDLRHVDFAEAWSSDLRRAAETLDIIRGERVCPVERLVDMRPLNIGDFEGLPKTSHWMGILKTYLDTPAVPIPGGASLNWFRRRYGNFFKTGVEIAMRSKGPLLWVQHATTNHELGHILFDDIDALDVEPGGIIGIWATPEGLRAKALARPAVQGSGYAYS